MLSQEEHRRQLRRADMLAAVEARQQERRRQAEERARHAEEAQRAEEEKRQATPTYSTDEIAAAFSDWERRMTRGGSLASQRF